MVLPVFLPAVRRDVEYFSVSVPEGRVISFYDTQQFVPKSFSLNAEAESWLSLFNGKTKSADVLLAISQSGDAGLQHMLFDFYRLLNDHHVLETAEFKAFKEQAELDFEHSDVRPMVCADSTFPADSAAARAYFDAVFSSIPAAEIPDLKGIFAPHIDYRIGLKTYVSAFKALQKVSPKRIVILATSHYSGLYYPRYENIPLIASKKRFETPFGFLETDVESINQLLKDLPACVSGEDRAHRMEHSIELHAVLLKYLLPPDVKVLPLLVTGFDDVLYAPESELGNRISRVGEWLHRHFGDDDGTVFCVSGDLAHVGRKFGDRKNARIMLPEVREFDQKFNASASSGSADAVLKLMRTNNDAFRICGFPPLFQFLKSMPNLQGEIAAYDVWDEHERNSAVTFSALVFGKKPA